MAQVQWTDTNANANPYAPATETVEPPRRKARWVLRLLGLAAVLLLMALAVAAAFSIGALAGESGAYNRRTARLMEQAQGVLDQNPNRFARVTVKPSSAGRAFLSGSVDSEQDFEFLKAEMQRVFGEATGEEMAYPVEVVAPE